MVPLNPLGVLSEIASLLAGVREDTKCLPSVNAHLEDVADQTVVLHRMDERMAAIEAAMPTLVEVQQHLADLPQTIEGLDRDVSRLADQIDRLLGALGQLDHDVHVLSESVEPLGRLADRMPGGNRR